jgi:hypothetical protein
MTFARSFKRFNRRIRSYKLDFPEVAVIGEIEQQNECTDNQYQALHCRPTAGMGSQLTYFEKVVGRPGDKMRNRVGRTGPANPGARIVTIDRSSTI